MNESEGLVRGELPSRLIDLLTIQCEVTRAAVPWLNGTVHAPATQLTELAETLKATQILCDEALEEARVVLREQRRVWAQAHAVAGRAA